MGRRSKSSDRWLKEHFADPFVQRAQREGWRSRAVFKLEEIDRRARLLKPGQTCLDLGAAPGAWSQYARRRVGRSGRIVATDILAIRELAGVEFVQGDFREEAVFGELLRRLPGRQVDLVLSDMAPALSGVDVIDQPRSLDLAELALDLAARVLQGEMIYGVHKDKSTFKTRNPETDYTALIGTLLKAGAQIESREPKPPTFFGQLLLQMAPALLLILVFLYMLRQMQGASGGRGAMSFGKSRARLLGEDQVNVTFADVAGVEEAKQEVAEIVDFLKDPGKFQKLGGKIPKGVLMVRSPGTGKTLLARAIAGEAKVPFFTISGSDFVEMFVGVGASRVRDMFEQAKKHAPCIIFIKETEAVGLPRRSAPGGGHI